MKTNVSLAPIMELLPGAHALVMKAGLDADVISILEHVTKNVSDASVLPNGTVLTVPRTPLCHPRTVCVSVSRDGMETVVLIRSTHVIHHVLHALRRLKAVPTSAQRATTATTSMVTLADTATHVTLAVSTAVIQRQPVLSAMMASIWRQTFVSHVIHAAAHALDLLPLTVIAVMKA